MFLCLAITDSVILKEDGDNLEHMHIYRTKDLPQNKRRQIDSPFRDRSIIYSVPRSIPDNMIQFTLVGSWPPEASAAITEAVRCWLTRPLFVA